MAMAKYKSVGEYLNSKYEPKQRTLVGIITSVPLRADGRNSGKVIATVAGQAGIQVNISSTDVYYVGDSIRVRASGSVTQTEYSADGITAAVRPSSGIIEYPSDVTIGIRTFGEGDITMGDATGSHFWFDYSEGNLYMMKGDYERGVISADGYLDLGNKQHAWSRYTDTAIEWYYGDALISGIDGAGRTIYGFERWGRPSGPAIEIKEILDVDENGDPILNSDGTQQKRYGVICLDHTGAAVWSLLTGTETSPNTPAFYFGREEDAQRLNWEDGVLNVYGHVYMLSGEIQGVLTIGTSGGIYQGTGTFDSPTTGMKMWNDGGIGRISSYAGGVSQAYFDTDGGFKWAGGKGVLSYNGLSHTEDANNYFRVWNDTQTLVYAKTNSSSAYKTAAFQNVDGTGVQGYATGSGIGVHAAVNGTFGTGLLAESFGASAVSIEVTSNNIGIRILTLGGPAIRIINGYVDGGGERYTNLGAATSGMDAVNRDTADARYLMIGSSLQYLSSVGSPATIPLTTYGTLSHTVPLVTKTGNYTLAASDYVVLVNGTYTMSLPTASNISGTIYYIKNIAASVVAISASNSETIDGSATISLSSRYDELQVVSNGTNWYII